MKDVAIITNSLSGGGAERAMNLLADSLSKFSELTVLLIAINSGNKDLVEPECLVVEIRRKWKGSVWDSIRSFLRFQITLLKFKPQCLVLNCDLPEFYSAFAFWSGKCVIVEHTTKPWVKRRTLGRIVRFILKLRGASWIRVSERIPLNFGFAVQATIPNIVNPDVLLVNSRNYQSDASPGKLVFVGRLSNEKRPDLFVELARKTGIASIVIGDGVLLPSLLAETNNLASIEFLGQRKNPWECVSPNDLVVITSDYEGDCLVALEAAIIGVPVALRNIPDLSAIGFPLNNYFENISDLTKRINDLNFKSFLMDDSQKKKILAGRSAEEVSLKWLSFIHDHR